jgi:hypothetical protein
MPQSPHDITGASTHVGHTVAREPPDSTGVSTHVGHTVVQERHDEPPLVPANGPPTASGLHPAARFETGNGAWQLKLSHTEVKSIADGIEDASGIAVTFGVTAEVAGILLAIAEVLRTVDAIGLNNGVNVAGILQMPIATVTPAFFSPFDLVKWIGTQFEDATGIPHPAFAAGIGAGAGLLAVGPSGIVLGGLAGWLGTTLDSDDPRPGDVHCDRHAVGPWEKFVLFPLTPNRVAIGSWRGYFSAENGGGGAVHANRGAVGDWETVILIHNPNGTVSLQHPGGHFLVAENGGGDGSVCNWNRTAIGDWEQFWMEFQPDGTFALKTFSKGTYVSVQ